MDQGSAAGSGHGGKAQGMATAGLRAVVAQARDFDYWGSVDDGTGLA